MTNLFCFGLGYSALELSHRLTPQGWSIAGTSTSAAGTAHLKALGFDAYQLDGGAHVPALDAGLARVTHVLVSAPPETSGDPILRCYAHALERAPHLKWIGYLSTIGVYGDHQGRWVDENTPVTPGSERSRRRVVAETEWLDFASKTGKAVQIFRLAGIYGPGRSAIDSVRDGSARRIIKSDQVFNRIHVTDIAGVLEAAIARPVAEKVFNVTDDEPAPPQDVIAYAADLLGLPVPPGINFTDATFSPMGRSFYSENKRVHNDRIKQVLGAELQFPTYREGLRALAKA